MDGHLTSELLWRCAIVVAVLDAPLLALVARRVPAEAFRALKWRLAAAAYLVYGLLWLVFGSLLFWEAVYGRIFPAWFRWPLPVVYGALFGAVALAFWRLSAAARRWPAMWFCVLGGLVSLVGHGIGIRRGLLRVPLLADVSAASALVFGVFEFVAYWCAIVGIAMLSRRLPIRRPGDRGSRTRGRHDGA
jgi:hypothetical protein